MLLRLLSRALHLHHGQYRFQIALADLHLFLVILCLLHGSLSHQRSLNDHRSQLDLGSRSDSSSDGVDKWLDSVASLLM